MPVSLLNSWTRPGFLVNMPTPRYQVMFAETGGLAPETADGVEFVGYCSRYSARRTFWNADGEIEVAEENCMADSESLTAWYSSSGIAASTAVADPAGKRLNSKIWKIERTAPGNSSTYHIPPHGMPGETYFISFKIHLGNLSEVVLFYLEQNVAYRYASVFDDGTASFDGAFTDTSITDLGGGWHEVRAAYTATNSSGSDTIGVRIPSGVGANGDYFYLCEFQASRKGFHRYVPSRNSNISYSPRIDHDPETGECLGLLIEPNSTNICHSWQDSSAWGNLNTPAGDTEITDGAGTGPDGVLNTVLLHDGQADEAMGFSLYNGGGFTATSSGSWTLSIYVRKAAEPVSVIPYLRPRATGSADVSVPIRIDPYSGEFTGSATVQDCGQWWRVSATMTVVSGDALRIEVRPAYSGSLEGSSDPTLTGSVEVWGAQFEAGIRATTYIPVFGESATRYSEIIAIRSDDYTTIAPDLTEGTVVVSGEALTTVGYQQWVSIDDGSYSNRIALATQDEHSRCNHSVGGTTSVNSYADLPNPGTVIFSWDSSGNYRNRTEDDLTVHSVAYPGVMAGVLIQLGGRRGIFDAPWYGHVRDFYLFDEPVIEHRETLLLLP